MIFKLVLKLYSERNSFLLPVPGALHCWDAEARVSGLSRGLSLAYLRPISGLSKNYLRTISGLYLAYLRPIRAISGLAVLGIKAF
jgi:hypothetical protein